MKAAKFLIAMLLVSLLSGQSIAQGPPQGAAVVTDRVTEEVIPELKTYVGTVLPLKRTVVGSAVDGRVVTMHAEVGARVEAGGALAQLLTETIKLELVTAKAELELRQQELNELEAGSRKEELEQAKSRLLAAEAFDVLAQGRVKRSEELFRRNSISIDGVEEAKAIAERSSQEFQEAKAAYELAVAGPREERKAQARARVAMQSAIVEQTDDRLTKHTIITRFAGYVVSELAEEGQWVKRGDPVAEVVALDQVEVEVHVVEQSINQLVLGTKVQVEIPAVGRTPLIGTVSAIVPQADIRTRTFPVRILLSNELVNGVPKIKSGMYARAKLPTGDNQPSKLVHKDALVMNGTQASVFAVVDGKAKLVPVQLGEGHHDRIQVTGDLKAGDQVVVLGNERLRPGTPVNVIRTMQTAVEGTTASTTE